MTSLSLPPSSPQNPDNLDQHHQEDVVRPLVEEASGAKVDGLASQFRGGLEEVLRVAHCQGLIQREGSRGFLSGRLKGLGKRTYSGITEEGQFHNDQLHGQGRRVFKDGMVEEGEFKNGQLFNGQTTFTLSDGRQVQGEALHGQINGYGRKEYRDDQGNAITEEGEFKHDDLHGHGMRKKGIVEEEGEFKRGVLVKGKMTISYDDLFGGTISTVSEGSFSLRNGQPVLDGKNGKRTFVGRKVVQEGEFRFGIFTKGKISFYGIIAEGEFGPSYNGYEYLRKGRMTLPNGIVEEGDFSQGSGYWMSRLHGQGKRIFPDGTVQEGEFKDGFFGLKKLSMRHELTSFVRRREDIIVSSTVPVDHEGKLEGHGRVEDAFHTVREGEFSRGKIISGKQIYGNGNFEKGEFKNGQLVEGIKIYELGNATVDLSSAFEEEGIFSKGYLLRGKRTTMDGMVHEGDFYPEDRKLKNGHVKKVLPGGVEEYEMRDGRRIGA